MAVKRLDQIATVATGALRRPSIFAFVLILACAAGGFSAARHVRPFVDDVTVATSAGDDWLQYKLHAIDILDGGLTMPGLRAEYWLPGGFLYNYFVAGVFALTGRNSTHVYVVQGMLFPLAVLLWFVAGRRWLSPSLSLGYPLIVAFMLYRNAYPDLTYRLLSENVAIPLIAASVIALSRAIERDSVVAYAAAGALFGLITLTRPNLQLMILGGALLVAIYGRGGVRQRVASAGIVFACAAGVVGLLALRNGLVTGHYTPTSPQNLSLLPSVAKVGGLGPLATLFLRRALYCCGVILGGAGGVVVNKHLLAATLLALAQLVRCAFRRRMELIDAMGLSWMIALWGPFIALPALGGYGFRFQWPVAPVVLLLACRFLGSFLPRPQPAGPGALATGRA